MINVRCAFCYISCIELTRTGSLGRVLRYQLYWRRAWRISWISSWIS